MIRAISNMMMIGIAILTLMAITGCTPLIVENTTICEAEHCSPVER